MANQECEQCGSTASLYDNEICFACAGIDPTKPPPPDPNDAIHRIKDALTEAHDARLYVALADAYNAGVEAERGRWKKATGISYSSLFKKG